MVGDGILLLLIIVACGVAGLLLLLLLGCGECLSLWNHGGCMEGRGRIQRVVMLVLYYSYLPTLPRSLWSLTCLSVQRKDFFDYFPTCHLFRVVYRLRHHVCIGFTPHAVTNFTRWELDSTFRSTLRVPRIRRDRMRLLQFTDPSVTSSKTTTQKQPCETNRDCENHPRLRRTITGTMAAPVTSSTSTTGGDQAAAAAAAAASLQLLLREDPLLLDHGMTEWNPHRPDQAAIPYAAAVLQQSQEPLDHSSTAVLAKERADTALQDVERKLALVESLAVKLSRTSPEAVAGPLMRLHGHGTLVVHAAEESQHLDDNQEEDNKKDKNDQNDNDKTRASTTTTTTTLSSLRDRAHRLDRQSQVLETVAQRVQTSLERGLHRMNGACLKLERVLTLSQTLKMMLRAQFESVKLQTYDLTDVRDLTKAAAAVAILQDLWDQPELGLLGGGSTSSQSSAIALVQHWHPPATQTAAAVRQASQTLLHDYCRSQHFQPDEEEEKDGTTNTTKSRMAAMASLGATLQVYFHLGELSQAAWYVVNQAHDQAEAACRQLWNTTTLQHLKDQAASSSSLSLSTSSASATKPKKTSASTSSTTSNMTEGIAQRLVQLRLEAAEHWARGLAQAMTSVRHLQHVLHSKTDPESRNVFWTVVMTQGPCPPEYTTANHNKTSSTSTKTTLVTESLVTLFWQRTCRTMARLIQQVLHQVSSSHHKTKLDRADVAALYPPVRRVALQLVGQWQEPQSFAMAGSIPSSSSTSGGILGGSQALETALAWQSWSSPANGTTTTRNPQEAADEPPHTSSLAADSWTTPPSTTSTTSTAGSWASLAGGGGGLGTNTSASSLSLIGSAAATSASSSSDVASFQCREWKTLLSNDQEQEGLYPLQQAFVQACTQRLCQPLQYMFPDPTHDDDEDEAALILSEDGLPTAATNTTTTNPSMIPNSSLLPSKFDVQRFDENIRHELSLADPKEGGGEFTAVTMIAECVVNMISQFCLRARNALSKTHHHHHHKHHQLKNYLKLTSAAHPVDWTMTEALQHDRKVAAIVRKRLLECVFVCACGHFCCLWYSVCVLTLLLWN